MIASIFSLIAERLKEADCCIGAAGYHRLVTQTIILYHNDVSVCDRDKFRSLIH
jgi:hypothetical protein